MWRARFFTLVLPLIGTIASSQTTCPPGAVQCKVVEPGTGTGCGESLSCSYFALPSDTKDLAEGHYVGVHLSEGAAVRYSTMPTESIDYTLKYTGGCEASGGTLKVQLEGTSYVRLEDKPWWASCTNLVPVTFEAALGPRCGCKLQIPAPASGPDSCRQGFVWREACGPSDHVCVLPRTRDETAQENQLASSRVALPPQDKDKAVLVTAWNKDTCKRGYVWREACGPSDHVCVPPSSRERAKSDNASASDRIAHFLGQ